MDQLEPSQWATCGLAIGRLSAAVDRSSLRALWLSHETARVVSRLFSRGAAPISAPELLGMAAGLPGDMPSVEEAAARRFWTQALRLWSPRVAMEPSATVPEITNRLRHLSEEGLPPGDLALETPLRLAAASLWPLPSAALALPPEGHESWEMAFVPALIEELEGAHERLRSIERDFGRWRSLLPPARSDSRLGDAVVLLGTAHALTPRYVGDALGLTRQASARLLKRLESLGIVKRATARQRWLIYLAANVPAPVVPEITKNEPARELVDMSEIDRVLENAYAALDKTARLDDA
ncbi:hypothetical protein HK107_13670 [Parvularcula sp. ZS-1/3]|uniref:Uncharacterized protein n=1 Tax=Parvularcula mediterranea TaxID=2732508 RepID=A0A7Y3W620_9PROT|nr:helix-turn-helix domain-containing protein [Parvularcula mediterranea]NNU17375.1 hypothetical protein [Parvularcula mediterranea]